MQEVLSTINSFEHFRTTNSLYVDKTEYLFKLLKSNDNTFFLSRPRRFGKSLTVSTLEAIFHGEKELFEGIAIYDKYDWVKTYPVIRIDMSRHNSDSPQRFENSLARTLKKLSTQYQVNVDITPDDITSSFADLIEAIASNSKSNQVVVLIDEYDYPIIENLSSKNLNDFIRILKSFYMPLKICSTFLRFVFITGVSKFSHVSIFSGLNNLEDISMRSEYATMLGYTQKELEENFAEYIEEACTIKGMERTQLLAEIAEWYDGYRFSKDAERVYNPMSIACFFSDPKYEFNRCWYATGTPSFWVEYAKKTNFDFIKDLHKSIPGSMLEPAELDYIDLRAIMFQTGYLTIKDSSTIGRETFYDLDYPNYEVKHATETFLIAKRLHWKEADFKLFTLEMYQALENQDLDTFMDHWITIIANAPYLIPIDSEGRFQLVAHICLFIASFIPELESPTNQGRIDNKIAMDKTVYIFEYKRNRSAAVGLKQIKDKGYYQKYLNQGEEVILVGISYSDAKKQITDWTAEWILERGDFIEEIHPKVKDPRVNSEDPVSKPRKQTTTTTHNPQDQA